jgi:hypothetical protein
MDEQSQLPLPPIRSTADGRPRRIGVEIEFSGLSIDAAAALLADTMGGQVTRKGRYELAVEGDAAGPWQVELDFELLKTLGRRERDDSDLGDAVEGLAEDALRLVAEPIVPVEVVSPPLPMTRLGEVNTLIARLREAGARGTGDDPVYAFGMQFNPEMPDTDADGIRHYLQAYLCLEDWLRERARVDLTRRLTFFADPFPKGYVRRAVDPAYSPNRARLIDDYLDDNPTRNRGLDMLPLFAHVDEARVRARIDDERIKARPTLHYRIPNSEIDRPDWDLSRAWADWLVVERLAADPARLGELCRTYAAFLDRFLGRLTGNWPEDCEQWLDANGLR